MSDLSDEILFSKFKAGDHASFDILLARYASPLFSLILKSVRNRPQADDIFQDVFFKVIEKKDLFRQATSFKAWVFTICRNTCIDAARKHKRGPKIDSLFQEEGISLEEVLPAGRPSAVDKMEESEENKMLDHLLEVLPPEQRETFYLKVKGELTFEEIGEVMNCSVNTAKSRMRYALEQLRATLKKRGMLK